METSFYIVRRCVPFAVALFTTMSNSVHGLIPKPVFRIGAGLIESIGAVLFLIPQTARLGAAIIAAFMVGVILSHVFVLGYGWAFVDALGTFSLPCVYLLLTRNRPHNREPATAKAI